MASDQEDKLSKSISSTNTELSEARGFQATSTPTGSVKGDPLAKVASDPVQRPAESKTTENEPAEKVSGIFSLRRLNETFPSQSNLKGN